MQGEFRGRRLRELLAGLGEGELRIEEPGRAGGPTLEHRVLVRAGRPVAARVRGRFDPLLARLRAAGALDPRAHHEALSRLATTERRAGEVARTLGVGEAAVAAALRAQLDAALDALARRVDGTRARFAFEPRVVRPSEITAWLPTSRTTRPRPSPSPSRSLDRATFRRLARELHPDRGGELSPEERARNASALAELTARWHGLTR